MTGAEADTRKRHRGGVRHRASAARRRAREDAAASPERTPPRDDARSPQRVGKSRIVAIEQDPVPRGGRGVHDGDHHDDAPTSGSRQRRRRGPRRHGLVDELPPYDSVQHTPGTQGSRYREHPTSGSRWTPGPSSQGDTPYSASRSRGYDDYYDDYNEYAGYRDRRDDYMPRDAYGEGRDWLPERPPEALFPDQWRPSERQESPDGRYDDIRGGGAHRDSGHQQSDDWGPGDLPPDLLPDDSHCCSSQECDTPRQQPARGPAPWSPAWLGVGRAGSADLGALLRDEATARAEIEWQVFPGKHTVLSLAAAAAASGAGDTLSALLPNERWDNDACRVALAVGVMRGDLYVVEHVLSNTAFLGVHRVAVTPPQLAIEEPCPLGGSGIGFLVPRVRREYGLLDAELPEGASFTGLAAAVMLRGLEKGEGPAARARRAEVLRALLSVQHVAYTDVDELLLRSVAAQPHYRSCPEPQRTLRWWAPQLPALRDASRWHATAARSDVRNADPTEIRQWEPAAHCCFPSLFRRRMRVLAAALARRGLRGVIPHVIAAVNWQLPRPKASPPFPYYQCVLDSTTPGGRVVALDASEVVMAAFAACTTTGEIPRAGQRVAAICSASGGSVRTGMLTGCNTTAGAPMLMWRPKAGFPCSEPLGRAGDVGLKINVLPSCAHESLPTRGGWFCGICQVLNDFALRGCRRCMNTHRVALSLEAQRRRQHPASSPPPLGARGSGGGWAPPLQQQAGQAGWMDYQGQQHNAGLPGTTTVIRVVRTTGGPQGLPQSPPPPQHSSASVSMAAGAPSPLRVQPDLADVTLGNPRGQGASKPFRMLNVSVFPPRPEVFEASDELLLRTYGCQHGERLSMRGETGIVLGVGSDGALYWVRDGGPGGAETLAKTVEDFCQLQPSLIGTANLPLQQQAEALL
eukprot:TRINITY_DN55665_c0_g1_i1.p1 TRINITY_DN55665_c0_g1~~TRINITY_DN55665_c0_g1_i1.p1  ORF type:complete len:918 (+),score=234.77 TRINITY_DN55665_c0_g1_i1:150-2903(+)